MDASDAWLDGTFLRPSLVAEDYDVSLDQVPSVALSPGFRHQMKERLVVVKT